MKFQIEYEGEEYLLEWFDDYSDEIKFDSASGFIFNDDEEFCVVKVHEKKDWALPGGGVEKEDKILKDTFIRETKEEADLELKEIKFIGYMKSFPVKFPDKINFSARFVAKVKKINPQTIDPAYGVIPERRFIKKEEFERYLSWGENGKFQLEKAINNLKE
jgi:8-oxo-dGTP pyrophosphatase MutT (NUDIX family)